MSLMFIEEFLERRFFDMPRTIRVMTYFAFVVTAVYLALLPKFIYGRCYGVQENGGEIPCFGQYVYLTLEGRTILQRTDEHGSWAVPVLSGLPTSIEVLFSDGEARHPITISWSDVFRRDVPKVIFDPETSPPFRLATSGNVHESVLAPVGSLGTLWGLNTAFAQTRSTARLSEQPIAGSIKELVANTRRIDIRKVRLDNTLQSLGFTKLDHWKLVNELTKRFNVSIGVEEWDRILTVRDIIELIERKRT